MRLPTARRPVADGAGLHSARAKLALRWSAALCLVAAVVVGGVYLALSRSLHVEPTDTRTVVEAAPDGSRETVTTEAEADVEGLVARRALDQLRSTSLVALAGLFGTSLLVGWVVAGRVLAPIDQAMAAQRHFVQDASHDLRNPLAAMRANLDLALEDPTTPPATWRRVGDGLRDSVDRMATVVDALLRTARDEAPAAHAEPFDPAGVLRTVVAQVEPSAARAGIAVAVDAEPGEVSGDPAAIERAVANLVDNAVRHAPTGSTVRLSGRADAGQYDIRVRDDGAGIADPDAVFDRGHRASDSPGLGLGLAIARDIVTAHHGSVDLERTGPDGTTFLVTLPGTSPEK